MLSYRGADSEMAAQAHARGADAARAGGQGEEVVDGPARVLVVRLERLFPACVSDVSFEKTVSESLRTFSILKRLPLSVSSTSYLRGSGPTKSWYEDGAATMYPWPAI